MVISRGRIGVLLMIMMSPPEMTTRFRIEPPALEGIPCELAPGT